MQGFIIISGSNLEEYEHLRLNQTKALELCPQARSKPAGPPVKHAISVRTIGRPAIIIIQVLGNKVASFLVWGVWAPAACKRSWRVPIIYVHMG